MCQPFNFFRCLFNLIVILFITCDINGQQILLGEGFEAHPSAALEVRSSSQGVLLPRMTNDQIDAIVDPADGLQVYSIDDDCTHIYTGTDWSIECPKSVGTSSSCYHWQRGKPLKSLERTGAVSFVIDGQAYVGSGYNGCNNMNDFYKFEAEQEEWTSIASFPGSPFSSGVAFTIGNYAYVGTGHNGTESDEFYKYDPTMDNWTQVASYPMAVSNAIAFSIGPTGYVGCGSNLGTANNLFYKYDPILDQWEAINPLPGLERFGGIAFTVNDIAYVGGGYKNGSPHFDYYKFDAITEVWAPISNIPMFVVPRSSFTLNNQGYVGPSYYSQTYNYYYRYNPLLDEWIKDQRLPGLQRYGTISFVLEDIAYVGTGYAGCYKNDFYKYSNSEILPSPIHPPTGNANWEAIQPLPTPRSLAVTFSIDKNVYVGGGTSTTGNHANFYKYIRHSNTWDQVASFPDDRLSSVAFSIGEYAYVGTGADINGAYNDFYRYDEVSNSWITIAAFPGSARSEAVAFTVGDEAFVGTGFDNSPADEFYKYNPNNDTWTQIAPLPNGTIGAVAFTLFGAGYVGGGNGNTAFYKYNEQCDTWHSIANFPDNNSSHMNAFTYHEKAYVITTAGKIYEYDPDVNEWAQVNDFNGTARQSAISFVIEGYPYFGTGWDGDRLSDIYKLTPQGHVQTTNYQGQGTWSSSIITYKQIESTSASNQGGHINLPTGIASEDIIKVSIAIDSDQNGSNIPPNYTFNNGYEYFYWVLPNGSLNIVNSSTNSSLVVDDPMTVTITYLD